MRIGSGSDLHSEIAVVSELLWHVGWLAEKKPETKSVSQESKKAGIEPEIFPEFLISLEIT